MTKIVWGQVPAKYEAGVNRGVLYPLGGPGVPWNGLISVKQATDGGDKESFYFDGIKYLDRRLNADFTAEISCFSVPPEFDHARGYRSVVPGFIITCQDRSRFGFAYCTGTESGYKIHLVYNAMATPASSRTFQSTGASVSVTPTVWNIDAVPETGNGYKPTAHFTIDSNKTDPEALVAIEGILYGYVEDPRLPTISELESLLGLRFVIVIASPDPALLPPRIRPGDLVFSISDEVVYSYGLPTNTNIRPVIVISGETPVLPARTVVGDIVYNETTGVLYKIGA